MNKIKKLPEDAQVIMEQDSLFIDGMYVVTSVDYDPDLNQLEIVTDHDKIAKGWEDK